MRGTIETLLLVILVAALAYLERGQLGYTYRLVSDRLYPCASPITYTIGNYDARFGISEDEFKKAIADAEALWETAAGKELFEYKDTGALEVSLVYDSRQEATDKLKKLGLVVKNDRASYDLLKAKYDSLEVSYKKKKASYDAKVAAYETKRDAYDAEVSSWNSKGGAPRDVYSRLQASKAQLTADLAAIRATETGLNEDIGTINALVEELNRLATSLNITASEFNQVGANRGEEFTEGIYQNSSDGENIDIYQFDSKEKLVRVLAHELGHALSLNHVESPKAIMYRLNQGLGVTLAAEDIAELTARCRL